MDDCPILKSLIQPSRLAKTYSPEFPPERLNKNSNWLNRNLVLTFNVQSNGTNLITDRTFNILLVQCKPIMKSLQYLEKSHSFRPKEYASINFCMVTLFYLQMFIMKYFKWSNAIAIFTMELFIGTLNLQRNYFTAYSIYYFQLKIIIWHV